jgi:hypothetical protein
MTDSVDLTSKICQAPNHFDFSLVAPQNENPNSSQNRLHLGFPFPNSPQTASLPSTIVVYEQEEPVVRGYIRRGLSSKQQLVQAVYQSCNILDPTDAH